MDEILRQEVMEQMLDSGVDIDSVEYLLKDLEEDGFFDYGREG